MSHTPEEIERYRRLMEQSRAPQRHREQVIKTPSTHPWNVTLNSKLLPKLGTGFLIVLHGGRGPGKTQLATELIRQNCMDFKTSYYSKIIDLLVDVKSSWGKEAKETEREVLERFCAPKLLVIDEVTERREKEWDQQTLLYLVDRRYDEKKDTLLIGNLSKDEMELSLGPSITSRSNECGGFIDCKWRSFRTL